MSARDGTPHGRPPVALATALADVATALAAERPAWCSRPAWKALRAAVDLAGADLGAAVGPTLPTPARWKAEDYTARLGAGRSTVARWLNGWLRR